VRGDHRFYTFLIIFGPESDYVMMNMNPYQQGYYIPQAHIPQAHMQMPMPQQHHPQMQQPQQQQQHQRPMHQPAPPPPPPANRKRKAPKDENRPKRPLSAFFIFSNENRPDVTRQHPEWKVSDVAKELGRQWATINPDEKKRFEEKAMKAKAKYERQMQLYEQGRYVPGQDIGDED